MNKRFIAVNYRKAATLLPLIQDHVVQGSLIWTDQWDSYSRLEDLSYVHSTVNHRANFVDPLTGAHTQGVERARKDEKV